MGLPAVDERCIRTEGNVVQEQPLARAPDIDAPLLAPEGVEGSDRIVPVETEIASEVVARAEGNADERDLLLDRYLCDRRERPVAACDPQHFGSRVAGKDGRVLSLAEGMRLNPALAGGPAELFGARRPAASRTRVDQDESGHEAARV
jgi:hypothetical protein